MFKKSNSFTSTSNTFVQYGGNVFGGSIEEGWDRPIWKKLLNSVGLFGKKKRLNSTVSFKRTKTKQLTWQGIEQILPPKQTRRPLPSLLFKSFFYGWKPCPFQYIKAKHWRGRIIYCKPKPIAKLSNMHGALDSNLYGIGPGDHTNPREVQYTSDWLIPLCKCFYSATCWFFKKHAAEMLGTYALSIVILQRPRTIKKKHFPSWRMCYPFILCKCFNFFSLCKLSIFGFFPFT